VFHSFIDILIYTCKVTLGGGGGHGRKDPVVRPEGVPFGRPMLAITGTATIAGLVRRSHLFVL
jgi:hypothetical protein